MLVLFWLLSIFLLAGPSLAFDDTCPPQGGAYALCNTTVLYILDITTDLQGQEIDDELDWIRYHIIPGTAWGTSQQLALISYGTGIDGLYPTGNRTEACYQLNYLQGNYEEHGSGDTTLLTTIQTVDILYHTISNMILFSASKDPNDIQATGDYIRTNMATKHFTVIALDGADFTGFPATVYNVDSFDDPPPNLGPCIIKNACSQGDDCDITGATDAPVYFPSTTVATTAPTTTTSTTTTTIPAATTPEYETACKCNYSQVWLDVVFLFDASALAGFGRLDTMWHFVQSTLTNFNVQRADYTGTNYSTRVGIVTYGNKGYVYKPLGSVNNSDLAEIEKLPYNNEPLSNLEDGIYVAASQLSGPNARLNARHVIVTLTTIYKPDGVDPPQPTAINFKGNGGILIMWDFVPTRAVASQTLEELASPGYYFSNDLNNTSVDLMQAFCDVNCFCYPLYLPYTMSQRQYPTDGCYVGIPILTNFRLSQLNCAKDNNGFLAISQSAMKNSFLTNRLRAGSTYYIGLSFDSISGQWIWSDGSPLGSYAPWQSGSPIDGSNSRTCAYVNRDEEWVSTDCRNGYYAVCEVPPCDSMNYCA